MEHFDTADIVRINGRKVAMLLPNPCNPDYRVIKHAEFFARKGYNVRVYCRWAEGLPFKQVINDVTYIRRPITGKSFLLALIKSLFVRHKSQGAQAQSTCSTKP